MSIWKHQLPDGAPAAIPGRLLSITASLYEGDWQSIRHSHPFAELFYVKSGKGSFLIENQRFPIAKGQLVIINPGVEHTEVSLESAPLEYISLGVEDLQFAFKNNANHFLINCMNIPKNLSFYFSAILEEAEQQISGYETICQNLLEILTLHLLRHTNSAFEIVPPRSTNRECARIRRYIDTNYQDDITLDTLANLAHLNKYYFVHAFTKIYGQSPMNYLTGRRIQVSQDLLKSSDYSISEIARMAGFSSSSYFSQCFRKYCKMTAQAYRKQHAPQ